jgi:hypothetical protein
VDGHHDIRAGDQVDLAPDQLADILGVALERLDGQVDAVLGPREPGASGISFIDSDLVRSDVEDLVDRGQCRFCVRGRSINVDPQQPLRAEGLDDLTRQLDPAIVPVSVEQARGGNAQWTRLSNPAARTAMIAVAYWIASMIRSSLGSPSSDGQGLNCGSTISVSIGGLTRIVSPSTMRAEASHGPRASRPHHNAIARPPARPRSVVTASRMQRRSLARTHDVCAAPTTVGASP